MDSCEKNKNAVLRYYGSERQFAWPNDRIKRAVAKKTPMRQTLVNKLVPFQISWLVFSFSVSGVTITQELDSGQANLRM